MTMYATTLGGARLGGFDFMDMLNPIGGMIKAVTGGDKKQDSGAGAFTFCPPGQMANPQWAAIPPEARAQAAASGIQACIPSTAPAAAGGGLDASKLTLTLRFIAAGRAFPGTAAGFADALTYARQDAQRLGRATLVARARIISDGKVIKSKSIDIAAAVTAAGQVGVAPGAAPPSGVVPATQTADGRFTCPAGLVVARNAQNQVVCAPPAAMAAQARAAGRRVSRAERRSGRSPRRRGLRDALGDFLAMDQNRARVEAAMAYYPGAHPSITMGQYKAAVPAWLAQRLPPPRSIQIPAPKTSLDGAFGL